MEILAWAEIGLKWSDFGHGYIYKTCPKSFINVIFVFPTHKKPIIPISQSKIGPKLEISAWAGIGLKLSHFGHGYAYKT